MSHKKTLRLFEGTGIELEYMIVNRDTLDVLPIADELLKTVVGSYTNDYEKEGICWSNELALHVVELKTCGPVDTLAETADKLVDGDRVLCMGAGSGINASVIELLW